MSRCSAPGPVPKASVITTVSGSVSKCPPWLLLGQARGPQMTQTQALRSGSSQSRGKRNPDLEKAVSCVLPLRGDRGSQPGRPGRRDPQKDSCRSHPTSSLSSQAEVPESGIGLSSAIYQLCDLRCSSTSLCLSYLISKMEIL